MVYFILTFFIIWFLKAWAVMGLFNIIATYFGIKAITFGISLVLVLLVDIITSNVKFNF
jgi:hypothetical protein